MKRPREKMGRWALVTGASRGIGLELARGLAARGYNLVLVARGEQGLLMAAEELRGLGVEIATLPMDLAADGAARRVHEECCVRGLEVEVLVNNAGLFAYCDLADMTPSRVEQMLALHIGATTTLCGLFGGDMRTRGRGYILNMSSYAAWLPLAGLGVYSASKEYIRGLSRALREELGESGVVVTAAMPAGVATDLYGLPQEWQRRGVRWGVLKSPESVADIALRGLFAGRGSVVPGVMNRLLLPLAKSLPGGVKRALRKKTLGFQK